MKTLVAGSIMRDLILKFLRFPQGGESCFGEGYSYALGGKGSNQAVAMTRLGAECLLLGSVGIDVNGSELLASLSRARVRTDYIEIKTEHDTGLAVVMLEQNGDNRIVVFPGANLNDYSASAERAFAENKFDIAVMQMETDFNAMKCVGRLCREHGVPLVLDMGPTRDMPIEEIEGVFIATPNRVELAHYTGMPTGTESELRAAMDKLMALLGCRYVALKMGGSGSMLYDGSKSKHFSPFSVDPVDTTGAGDAFTAAFAYHYCECGDIEAAMVFGNSAGALATTKLGAQPSMPTRNEIEYFIRSQR